MKTPLAACLLPILLAGCGGSAGGGKDATDPGPIAPDLSNPDPGPPDLPDPGLPDLPDAGGTDDTPSPTPDVPDAALPDPADTASPDPGAPDPGGVDLQPPDVGPPPRPAFYVADFGLAFGEGRVLKVAIDPTPSGETLWTAAVPGAHVVLATRDGGVAVVGEFGSGIQRWVLARFDAGGGKLWTRDCCEDSSFSAVFDLAEDADGRLWVSDRYNRRIQVLDVQGLTVATVAFADDEVGPGGDVGPVLVLPSGDALAFTEAPSGSGVLWTLGLDGQKKSQVPLTFGLARHADLDPAGTDAVFASFDDGIRRLLGGVPGPVIPSDAMTDEFAVTPAGDFWRVYEDEPLVIRLGGDGGQKLKLMPDDLYAGLAAFNQAHGTAFLPSGDFNRLATGPDGSVFVPTHAEVFHLDSAGVFLHVYGGFAYASDVDLR
jgi:hypothetical protein